MLKSLEISGFKSFADRIRFDFAAGITCVVGPNGSGKSNVVDAIKWILGDQSAKSLRGKEMIDVIFNGASGRKPSGLAEATLAFDNSAGFLPLASAEVQIGRRIYRSGDAEYLINRAPARLKDVRDLFLGTGAGPASYCIIEQGRVDQILQGNPSARRQIFEEAAGISRFKSRKLDAERKLERVDQNVARLRDIVDEVEAQLNSIRSQAVKAARYRQVSEQLRELWLGLAADQHRDHSLNLAEVERRLAEEQAIWQRLNERLAEIESSRDVVDAGIAAVDDRLGEIERERASYREEAARHEATVRHQTARIREMDQDVIRLRRQRALIQSRARDAERESAAAVEQSARSEQDLADRKEALAALEARCREIFAGVEAHRRELEARRQQLLNQLREVGDATHRAGILKSQVEQGRAAVAQAEERQRDQRELISACREECAVREKRVATGAEQVARATEALNALQQERLAMRGVQEQFHKDLADRREQRSAWRARKAVLEDLESRQEGLGIGVKEILHRARTAAAPPWDQVIGEVAELIEVDLDHAALVEIALGRRAQAIVIDDLRPLIDYLNRALVPIAGRVAFVARRGVPARTDSADAGGEIARFLENLSRDPDTFADLSARPGVQCRADSLVRCSSRAPFLARQLLCDTWIVDTLKTAFGLAAEVKHGCRFVTLQGELIDADGTLTAGALRGESTPVSQKSELRRLKHDLLRIQRQIQDDEQRLDAMIATLTDADGQFEALQDRLQQALDQQARCKNELADQERRLDSLLAELRANEAEASAHQLRLQETMGQLAQAELQCADRDAETRAIREQIAALESGLPQSQQSLALAERQQNAEQLDLAKREERLQALRDARQRLEQEKGHCRLQVEEAERRLQQVLADRRRITLHVLNANSGLAESFLEAERLAVAAAQISAEKQSLRAQRGELVREENGLRENRRGSSDRVHKLESEAGELRRQLESLASRIDEEFQVRLVDVVASDASAVRTYLDELGSAGSARREEIVAPGHSRNPSVGAEVVSGEKQDASGSRPAADVEPEVDDPTIAQPPPAEIRFDDVQRELEARVNRLRRQLKLMGSVNTESLRDLDDLEHRFTQLSEQLADLVEAKKALEEILRRIGAESKRLFSESFDAIRQHFQQLFRKFFGGGEGNIVLEDSQDLLECGIEIVARPPGKELRSLSLLSGGEKTLAAIALLLAIFKSRPSPFCVLDEVDAALDEANVERFASVLQEFKQTTQFIMITHSKRTMAAADILYGVTMEESGVSKRLSVRFEDVGEDGEIRGAASDRPSPRQGREAA